MPETDSARTPTQVRIFIVLLLLVGAGLRFAAARGELWFDEVWSWELAASSASAWDIVELKVDNNHILNTLVIYAAGPLAGSWAYRLPAVIASSAALWFGYLLARRWNAGIPVLGLLAGSYMLILYGSEARGYAYLTACTLGAWWGLEEYISRPRIWAGALFGVCCLLGFLAQLPFAFAYSGFFLYSMFRIPRQPRGLQNFLFLHVVPNLAIIAIYSLYIEGLVKSGGDQFPLGRTLIAAMSLWSGGPPLAPGAYLGAAAAAVLVVVAVAKVFRESWPRGLMYLTSMVLAPAGVIVASGFEFVYPRHFLVPMIFGYVAVGCLLARGMAAGRTGRIASITLIVLFWVVNAIPTSRVIIATRTPDEAAFSWLVEHSTEPVITISADHDFRVSRPLTYYMIQHIVDLQKRGVKLQYVERGKIPAEGTEWKILHTASDWQAPPPAEFTDGQGIEYKQARAFPAASLSAFSWFLYRRVASPTD